MRLVHLTRLLAVAAAAAALVLGLLPGAAPPRAHAATLFGHDISWPQCPASQGGFGLPLPPADGQFVIIGLTRGLPFTRNPCLADQVQWLRDNPRPAHAYTIPAFPTAAQLTTYGSQGPWSTATRAGRLSNVGYAAARHAIDSLRSVGFAPPTIWIDVEPRPAQPWPSDTAAQRRENRYVVEGQMRAVRDAGFSYGLYSFSSGWSEITGGWRLPGVPVWATAGRLDYPDEALDRCRQPSFSGGRVLLSQWTDDVRDYNRTCEPYEFTRLPVPASTLSNSTNDMDGDWANDVLARNLVTNELLLYRGDGRGGWRGSTRVGTGWANLDLVETAGDLTGDGRTDVVARSRTTGDLLLYRGAVGGGLLSGVRVGTGWQNMNALVAPGDVTGDQRPDLLARHRLTGDLWLYPGDGAGRWLPGRRVGTGWLGMSSIIGPGDVDGDGAPDVVARRAADGDLLLYRGDGAGGWRGATRIGTGWQVFRQILGPGDFNGDRTVDVLAHDARTGDLWLYPRSTTGWLPRVRVGTGWNALSPVV